MLLEDLGVSSIPGAYERVMVGLCDNAKDMVDSVVDTSSWLSRSTWDRRPIELTEFAKPRVATPSKVGTERPIALSCKPARVHLTEVVVKILARHL